MKYQIRNLIAFEPTLDVCEVNKIERKGTFIYINDVHIKNVKPILLTKEWIIKFGFYATNKQETYFYHKNGGDFNLDTTEFISLSGIPEYEIKYVHQLQNIYSNLTGFDLNL